MTKGVLKLKRIKKKMKNHLKGFAADEDGLTADPIFPFVFGVILVIVISIIAKVA